MGRCSSGQRARHAILLPVKTRGTRFFGYYPGTVALVTAIHDGHRNVMSAGWHSALSMDPPLYGVAIGRERATHPLVVGSGVFGLNFLPFARARAVQGAGVLSLHDGPDKFDALDLSTEPGEPLVLTDAYLTYVCRVETVVPTGDHDWIVGRVQAVHHDPAAFDERSLLAVPAAVYLGRSEYVALEGERVAHPPEDFS